LALKKNVGKKIEPRGVIVGKKNEWHPAPVDNHATPAGRDADDKKKTRENNRKKREGGG